MDPDDFAKIFPLDLEATKPVHFEGSGGEAWLYRVTGSKLIPEDEAVGTVYIVDTCAGGMVACHPHIVGDDLKTLCREAANYFVEAAKAVKVLTEDAAILHILRAGAGYMVADVMKGAPTVDIRTEYRAGGYRAHSDPRRLVVSYRHYPEGLDEAATIVVPDTYATGRSAEAALLDLMGNGFKPERIILYGFMAVPALVRLGALCEEHGVDLHSFAICDLTQLAHNNYDMCIYGPDESLYKETRRRGALGSVINRATLQRLLPYYIPGLDQPGDWSERQSLIFDGVTNRSGDIRGHLVKSIGLIETLMEMNAGEEWYTDIHEAAANAELGLLRKRLMGFTRAAGGQRF